VQRSASVYDYFTTALRRTVPEVSSRSGDIVRSADDAAAVFSIKTVDHRIEIVNYKCSTCVTLVGFCEHLCELIKGRRVTEAGAVTAADLLALHREVPPERHNRADLAIQALHSAVRRVLEGGNI
jgi:NifU-like protein involved in Fe-S cluster formation